MGFTKPDLPDVDPDTFMQKPLMERMRILATDWVDNGFGSPKMVHTIYIAKIVFLYALGGVLVATLTSGLPFLHVSQWWNQPIVYLMQDSQTDLDFLLSLARRHGYVLLLQEEVIDSRGRVTRPAQLYFGPSNGTGLRQATVELGWGKSLTEFQPTLTTANQVKSVTVRGWNRDTKAPIEGKAAITDSDFNFNENLKELLNVCDPQTEQVVNEPVFTQAEADRRARDILLNQFRDMVTTSATTVGLPDLRAGRNVIISGVGSRFSGNYFMTQTTHSIGANGYTTQINARREDRGQSS